MLDPYEKLANAVIIRAVKDYRMMSGTAETKPEKQEIIDWILSRDFSAITTLDPHALVTWLKEEERK